MPSILNATTTSGLVTSADNSGSLQLQTNSGTTAVTIDTSQNVGIGTASPAAKLDVRGSSTFLVNATNPTAWVSVDSGLATQSMYMQVNTSSSDTRLGSYTSHPLLFLTNNTERMRITSGGSLCVNGTATLGYNEFLSVRGASNTTDPAIASYQGTTSSAYQINFQNPNGRVGSVTTSGTSTAFNTSSDYRLKENIAPMTGALSKVAQLKPVTYNWKIDGSEGQGFIAHELQEIIPDAVTGDKDAVETYIDDEGNNQTRPSYQGVDTSFLVATLTAAIQELKAELNEVRAELDATKAEVQALKGVA